MKPRIVLTLGMLVGVGAAARAQSSSCPRWRRSGRLRDHAGRLSEGGRPVSVMAPQLGVAITGGNATLGQGGALGGLGHFSIGVRVQRDPGSVPKSTTSRRRRCRRARERRTTRPATCRCRCRPRTWPSGSFKASRSDSRMCSASTRSPARVHPEGRRKRCVGRAGQSGQVRLRRAPRFHPGVDRHARRVGHVPASATSRCSRSKGTATGATLSVTNFDEETTAWRVVASKSLVVFGLAVGIGQDKYDRAQARTRRRSDRLVRRRSASSQEMSRTNLFGDLSFNMPIFKVVREIGQVTGGASPMTFNTFSGKGIVDARLYGSFGLRFAL